MAGVKNYSISTVSQLPIISFLSRDDLQFLQFFHLFLVMRMSLLYRLFPAFGDQPQFQMENNGFNLDGE